MPDINKIEEFADAVGSTTVVSVIHKRCTYIRNWNSKCKNCMNACKHNAIHRSVGRFTIDAERCTGCGACAAACPAGALVTLAPTQSEIVKSAKECAANYSGTAVFACARWAEKLRLDEERVTILPCLNYLDEYLICGLFACDIKHIAIVCPGCEGCEIDGDAPYFPVTILSARQLAKTWGAKGKVKVFKDCPDNLRTGRHKGASGSERRGAIYQAGGSVMGYVVESIDGFIDPEKARKEKLEKNKQVRVRTEEKFDISTYRSGRMLKLLDRIGQHPEGRVLESRLWATVDIDEDKCKYCGCCASMCATDALHYERASSAETRRAKENAPGTLTFEPAKCMNCGLCRDSCFNKAIIIGNRVPADELDDDVIFALYQDQKPKRRGLGLN